MRNMTIFETKENNLNSKQNVYYGITYEECWFDSHVLAAPPKVKMS